MRTEIPGYAALAEETLLTEVVAHVSEAVDVLSVSLAGDRPVTDDDVAFVRPHAARRARQGMPKAPATLRAANGPMSRPLCRWPAVARYDGHGSPNDAANFRCTGRQ